MKCAREESFLKTPIRVCIASFLISASLTGCLIASYESCVKKQYLILGFQSPPLMITRESAKEMLRYHEIFLLIEETNRDVLIKIAEETSVPIVIRGDTHFLDGKIAADAYSDKTALEILNLMARKEQFKYSIEEGWVKIE